MRVFASYEEKWQTGDNFPCSEWRISLALCYSQFKLEVETCKLFLCYKNTGRYTILTASFSLPVTTLLTFSNYGYSIAYMFQLLITRVFLSDGRDCCLKRSLESRPFSFRAEYKKGNKVSLYNNFFQSGLFYRQVERVTQCRHVSLAISFV